MKKKHNEWVSEWERASSNLAEAFSIKYFGNGTDSWWVADEKGGVFYINDRFFSIGDMVDYMRYGYTADQMFKHYDYALECHMEKKLPINIRNFLDARIGK